MRCVCALPAICAALACLLTGCDESLPSVDALAADPARLHALAAQCRLGEHSEHGEQRGGHSGEHSGAFCARVDQADLRRFMSGQAGPDEYRTLADVPPLPESFDEPGPELEPAAPGDASAQGAGQGSGQSPGQNAEQDQTER